MTLPKFVDPVLIRFMQEFFPFDELAEVGFFKPEHLGDYEAQAERVCYFFGYRTVYEYGAKEIQCHITDDRDDGPFITFIPSIYANDPA